jgi:hypothetical protein
MKKTVKKEDELFARISDAASCTKECEGQLSRTTRELRTGVAESTEVDAGISEYLL